MIEAMTAASGFHHVALASVGSTNDEAMARARAGADLPLWVSAERQMNGRGRQGAHWVSESGNLYASLVLRVASLRHLSELPLLAAVALHDALSDRLDAGAAPKLAIKWPNDILFDGQKVSGILAESQAAADNCALAVVGIGVNLAHHPQATRYPATDFTAQGVILEPATLFTSLDSAMAVRLEQWQGGSRGGFQAIRAAWLERVSGLGQQIEVRLPSETLTGRFDGMDDAGRLILHQPGRPDRLVSAGEVFFSDQSSKYGNI
jgi:BirA family biotin operon repressor/biotin-[acetyl-CoA-carboxylase] ligase